ncbi:MAG: hypothetical protein KGL02_11455 [Acidobacteriota bacterium]|nr:hypothetical protein [Acidobacteriota bacterium]
MTGFITGKTVSLLAFGALLLLLSAPLASVARAQDDPSGEWAVTFFEDQPDRLAGAEMGDYLGMPINPNALQRAQSWSAALVETPEDQCREHGSDYGWRGPSNLSIWKDVDLASQEVIAYHTHLSAYEAEQTIWMDGKHHEPPTWAPHTWQGFSVGHWEGDTLVVYTTHLKENWLGLNGLPRSDQAVATTHIMRHGDVLTVAAITYDPVYMEQPLIRTADFTYAPQQSMATWPCEPVDEVDRPESKVPSYMPGKNPYIEEFAARYGVPYEATKGGAETMYPEYMTKVKKMPLLPRIPKNAPQATSGVTGGSNSKSQ